MAADQSSPSSLAQLQQQHTIGFLLVAVCWGLTNPFIKLGTRGVELITAASPAELTLRRTLYLATRWQYVLPLALNLSGSAVYYYFLSSAPLSLAVPVTNSLTFVFTAVAGALLGETVLTWRGYLGAALVLLGVVLCATPLD